MTVKQSEPNDTPRVRIRPGGSSGVQLHRLPPLSLYVHVPWCVRKCPYCDFNSHELSSQLPEQDYLEALKADLEQALPLIWGRQIVSVFIGGGTPSLLSGAALDELLGFLRAYLNLWPETEITLEANPGTSDKARFKEYATSGVNRISLGIQSFNDEALKALGRIHDGAQARRAIETAQTLFERVNLDIMYGLPQQTMAALQSDVDTALAFDPGHLSFYQLTLEPNTVFAKYPPPLPEDDAIVAMHDYIIDRSVAAGYDQYEVSAYAKPGQRAIHNVNYWEFGDYLGIGPGAHSKLSFPDQVIRQARRRNPVSWMAGAQQRDASHIATQAPIATTDFAFEFMLNALRLKDGVPSTLYFERTGQLLGSIAPILTGLRQRGLLQDDPWQLKASDLGWRFLNDVQAAFLQE